MPEPPRTATRTLSEPDSKALLAGYGVPIAPERVVARRRAGAAAAAAEIGFPVVAKLAGDAHRPQDRAGPGAAGPRRRRARCARRRPSCWPRRPPTTARCGCSSRRCSRASRELIAGLAHDPQFGMTVMVGVGGILAEAVADVSLRLVPIDARRRRGDDRRPGDPGPARPVPRRAGRRPRRARRRAARPVRPPRRPTRRSCRPTSTR